MLYKIQNMRPADIMNWLYNDNMPYDIKTYFGAETFYSVGNKLNSV